MENLRLFRQERLKRSYWAWKGSTDALLAILSVLAIGFSGVAAGGLDRCIPGLTINNCENLTIFSYSCLGIGGAFLTFPLVRSTELAWAIRESIAKTGGYATYIAGTSSLPPTAFGEMWLRSGAPSYFWRVVMAGVNGLRFVVLVPVQLVLFPSRGGSNTTEFKQWICFMPSIALVFIQYLLLFVLLQQSETVLDALLATVSLQIFVELSQHFILVAFDREKSTGDLVLHYTAPFSNEAKCSAYIMDQLCVVQQVTIDIRLPIFGSFLVRDEIPLLLNLLRESLLLLQQRQSKNIHLKFVHMTAALFSTRDIIDAASRLFAAMNEFDNPRLTLEREDFDNFQDMNWLHESSENGMNLNRMRLVCTDGREGNALNLNANYQVGPPVRYSDSSLESLEEGGGGGEEKVGDDL